MSRISNDENSANDYQNENIIHQVRKLSNEEKVVLNIGGVKYETYRSTLEAYPDTFLGRMFQYSNQELLNPKNGNEYFFDRSGQLFHYIMQFYRTGKVYIDDQEASISKEIEIELDYFQIPHRPPRPTASLIDHIAIKKVDELINTLKYLISEVSEHYMKKLLFKEFKEDLTIIFLDNGQATVHPELYENFGKIFESTKHYAYKIMSLYKKEIEEHIIKEYEPNLIWLDEHKGDSLLYYKIKLTITWKLNSENILANSLRNNNNI
nr:11891_t:CDS:2 [Entrophospora candida]CAG8437867.1 12130_t:CDS:2 [Entrophospora candida]